MINHSAARTRLGTLVKEADLSATVYPTALQGLAAFPAIVLGQPSWEPDAGGCMDTTRFPVAVVVARPGSNDAHVQAQLEELWPALIRVLADAIDTDQTLGGICRASHIEQAEFGLFSIQGQEYPAQTIQLTLYG